MSVEDDLIKLDQNLVYKGRHEWAVCLVWLL